MEGEPKDPNPTPDEIEAALASMSQSGDASSSSVEDIRSHTPADVASEQSPEDAFFGELFGSQSLARLAKEKERIEKDDQAEKQTLALRVNRLRKSNSLMGLVARTKYTLQTEISYVLNWLETNPDHEKIDVRQTQEDLEWLVEREHITIKTTISDVLRLSDPRLVGSEDHHLQTRSVSREGAPRHEGVKDALAYVTTTSNKLVQARELSFDASLAVVLFWIANNPSGEGILEPSEMQRLEENIVWLHDAGHITTEDTLVDAVALHDQLRASEKGNSESAERAKARERAKEISSAIRYVISDGLCVWSTSLGDLQKILGNRGADRHENEKRVLSAINATLRNKDLAHGNTVEELLAFWDTIQES